MNINRRGFIGAMMASAAALAVGPAAAEEEFQDLRTDRYYVWQMEGTDRNHLDMSGRDLMNGLIRISKHPDFDAIMDGVDDLGLYFEEYSTVLGGFYRCERKIPVTRKWLEELYRRHRSDMEMA